MDNSLKFLENDAPQVARELIGWRLYVVENGETVGGIITETEAYTQADAASHSYRGETQRNSMMFQSAGYAYVYFTYGMHYCMNIVTGKAGYGQAVLIRALQPDQGIQLIRRRRNMRPDNELTNGPAKVCQALGVGRSDNGRRIGEGKFALLPPLKTVQLQIQATERIGIKQDTHRLWRFVAVNS